MDAMANQPFTPEGKRAEATSLVAIAAKDNSVDPPQSVQITLSSDLKGKIMLYIWLVLL